MAVAGIIAEYNPFHRGHAWQIQEVRRRLGADTAVVACMSGNFVQRGDFAILAKRPRAEAALAGGVDLVLELPTPWSAATAERFAQGGAAVLAASGVVTHLAFGCETGALPPLAAAAECLDSPAFQEALGRYAGRGMTFAAARQAAARGIIGGAADCLSMPNNILAVEYLRALNALGSSMKPLALPRLGAGHDSRGEDGFLSAAAIRDRILSGGGWAAALPPATAAVLRREMERGRAPADWRNCQRAILARLRRMEEAAFLPYDGGSEGLYHRFYAAVHAQAGVEDILTAAKTRRYPLSRLRRMLLLSYLGVPQAGQGQTPPYLRVLGIGARGRALLRRMRECASLPVIVKSGRVRRLDGEVQRVFDQEAACTELYALALPALERVESEYAVSPAMVCGPEKERFL